MRSEISWCIKSFVEVMIAVAEIIIDESAQGQLSSGDLRVIQVICSMIGIKAAPHEQEHI